MSGNSQKSRLKDLIARGKEQGYLTYAEVNDHLPEDISDPDSIARAIAATNYNSIVGPIDFSKGPVPNVAKTPLVGGQWHMDGDKPVLEIVENNDHPEIPLTGAMKPIG